MKQVIVILISTFFFLSCSSKPVKQQAVITTSTFALYDVTSYLAKDFFVVKTLLKPGMEVHTFEPTPKDITLLHQSKLFIFNGAGLEPWVEKFSYDVPSLDISKYVHVKKSYYDHGSVYDPHYWLDITNMIKATDVIAQKLQLLDPKNATAIQIRANEYKKMLHDLDNTYKKRLASCKRREIFVNHNAYDYLGDRYHFKVYSLVGLAADAKADPKTIQKLIDEIKRKNIKVIFGEEFENNQVIKMIAKDTNVSFETLQPLANITKQQAIKKENYKTLMLYNLYKLEKAMECQ